MVRAYRSNEFSLAEVELTPRVVLAVDDESNEYLTREERYSYVARKAALAQVQAALSGNVVIST